MTNVLRVLAVLALAWFYVAAATEHARVVNNFKARGDQSGYLGDAEQVYANWHGQTPPGLIGSRNRMPVYAGFLALFYNPRMSDPEFFEVAKIWNIRLSMVLLALLYLAFAWHLPTLVAANLTLVVAFGYFIFKAGYAQSELLFYFFFFLTFLFACYLLERRSVGSTLGFAVLTGVLAAVAHLTKSAVLPLLGILAAVYVGRELALLVRRRVWLASVGWRAAGGALMAVCFLAVIYPYISNSKRVFGRYFYNVNTTFYMWYEDWPEASVGPYMHGDGVGWPTLPDFMLMSPTKYWRRHTIGQMASRVMGGVKDMATRSYATFWYLKYVVMYTAFAAGLIAANRRAFAALLREHAAVAMFLALYAAVYLPAIGFYAPTSGTGTTRFLLAHVAPLLFVLSMFLIRKPFAETEWRVGGATITPMHFHLLVTATVALDVGFTLWSRVMTTYGGF